jgi:hypothetical protein
MPEFCVSNVVVRRDAWANILSQEARPKEKINAAVP